MQTLEIFAELVPSVRVNRVTGIRQQRETRQVGQCDRDGQREGQTRSFAHVNNPKVRKSFVP